MLLDVEANGAKAGEAILEQRAVFPPACQTPPAEERRGGQSPNPSRLGRPAGDFVDHRSDHERDQRNETQHQIRPPDSLAEHRLTAVDPRHQSLAKIAFEPTTLP